MVKTDASKSPNPIIGPSVEPRSAKIKTIPNARPLLFLLVWSPIMAGTNVSTLALSTGVINPPMTASQVIRVLMKTRANKPAMSVHLTTGHRLPNWSENLPETGSMASEIVRMPRKNRPNMLKEEDEDDDDDDELF